MLGLFLTGKVKSSEFLKALRTDETVQNEVRNVLPESVRHAPEDPFWAGVHYAFFAKCGFDMLRVLQEFCKFDDSIADNYELFSNLKFAYSAAHPDTVFTTKYEDSFDLYLNAVQDCYDGPEVRAFMEHLIGIAVREKSKAKRLKCAKEMIKRDFHVEGNHRPRWVQEPDWPMGKKTPMQFLSRTKKGETCTFAFQDVDTGAIREVTQWY